MTPTLDKKNLLPSGVNETPQETLKRSQNLAGSISANDLVNPPAELKLNQPPAQNIPDTSGTVGNVLGSIRSTSETAKKLAEEQAAFSSFADKTSGFDIQNEQLNKFGVTPEKLARLEDIQLQLSKANTANELQKAQIEGGAGQTIGQAQREVTPRIVTGKHQTY